jgi:hypothetical protein
MSTAAIWIMIIVQLSFTVVTAYFFFRVLRAPGKNDQGQMPEENS